MNAKKTLKEKPLAKKTNKNRELSWSNAGILMKKGSGSKEITEQNMIIALSVAFDIPPQGISILADTPYINKQGLEFVFDKYKDKKNWGYFVSEPVELARQAGDTAIFVTKLYDKDGKLIANGYGSANAANIRMGTIKVFLNEMAETRSQNRCLRKVLSPILYKTFIENVQSLNKEQLELVSSAASDFGSVTAEEIGLPEEEQKPEKLLTGEEMKQIAVFLQGIANAKDMDELNEVGNKINEAVGKKDINENQVMVLREAWAGKTKSIAFKR